MLNVIAYDGPVELGDTLSSRKMIQIHVIYKGTVSIWNNGGTGSPVDYYMVKVEEERPADTVVLKVNANVPQIYQSGSENKHELIYSIVEDAETNATNPYYKIDPVTGVITTTDKRLDYEETDQWLLSLMKNIRVRAASANGFFSYSTNVIVNLIDVNDNAPVFDLSPVNGQIKIAENTTRDFKEYVTTIKVAIVVRFILYADIFESKSNNLKKRLTIATVVSTPRSDIP
jgi:hypothetical protein